MIESIYIDVADDSRRTSRYIVLIERLAEAEQAKNIHMAMAARVLKLHDQRLQKIRAELEAEGDRLRKLIKVAKV